MKLVDTKLGQTVNCWFYGDALQIHSGVHPLCALRPVVIGGIDDGARLLLSNCRYAYWGFTNDGDYPNRYQCDEELLGKYQYAYGATDEVECELVFNNPMQKCVECGISMAHVEAADRIVCVPCKTLISLG